MRQILMSTLVLATTVACSDAPSAPAAPYTAAALSVGGDGGVGAAASTHKFAVVALNGTLISGNGASSALQLGPGQYEVTFSSNVSGCGYVATTSNAYSQAVIAYTAGGHLSQQGVYVETKNQGGGLTDGPFNLVVTCGTDGIPFAVVGYTANLVRGTAGVSLSHPSTGRYFLNFPTAVGTCAYLATVADPSNALVFGPAAVYTGSGATTNSVYIETKNPGGGLSDGIPFHLAIVCPSIPSTRFAVVKAGGAKQRANTSTTSVRTSTGNYAISTGTNNISACAKVATRGSVNTAVPFSPSTVEIAPGATPFSVGVQVRQLLFFGGAFDNQAFHIGIIC